MLGYSEESLIVGLKAEQHFAEEKKKRRKGKIVKNEQIASNINNTLLIFTANWCETCVYTYSMWVKFANRFTTPKL